MPHPDIELLHTWLDGELAPEDADALESHIGSCPACAALVREQRGLLTEAEALLAELDQPMPRVTNAAMEAAGSSHPAEWGVPVVLLPYHALVRSWRRTLLPGMGIAATLLVAVGAGWLALRPERSSTRRPAESQSSTSVGTMLPPPAPVDSGPADVTMRREAQEASRGGSGAPAPARIARGAPAPTQPSAPDSALAISRMMPMAAPRQAPVVTTSSSLVAPLREAEPQRVTELKAADEREPLSVALDAQITTRIGLDEASQRLGGKLHVIDGLRPELVGLVSGYLVAGADPSRPVVRVVYLGDDGRTFFLDQQRITDSTGPRTAVTDSDASSWRNGDVRLLLHGALSPASRSDLVRRIR